MIGYMEEHSEVNMVKSERPASPDFILFFHNI